ncbi:MAG: hypothetical protein J6386_20185 [Candidatus Synoicihabitans palmerolidicus]|nr:hypothetical protein [Candidatus Synoicihabitans palmerolidicus]MCC5024962.1 hypothetical protein [Candidatus Synoicihabitans palmerolidicus]
MPNEPPVFAKPMNRWCIAMTHSRRRRDAKRARKGVLRQMKCLLRTHRRATSAQRREDPQRLRTRRADRGPGQGVRRGRVWPHPYDQ